MTVRSTLNSARNHAMPMPRAAHCTHQWPGEVIRLMTKSSARMNGALNRKPTDLIVRNPGPSINVLSLDYYEPGPQPVAVRASSFSQSRWAASNTALASEE